MPVPEVVESFTGEVSRVTLGATPLLAKDKSAALAPQQ